MSNISISEPLPSPMKTDLPASPLGLSVEQQKALIDTSHVLLARVNEIVTESLQRPALRFATSDQSTAVTNQDYFLSMIHLLNPSLGNTHKARPGEATRAQKAHIKRQENYQELKAIRKKLYESLQNELASTHLDNLVSSIVSY